MKEEEKNQPNETPSPKARILREDDGKRTPPTHPKEVTGEQHQTTHPEQAPDVPPHERTEGIP
ncbi:hypothetical protein [Pontibacter sp. HSC-36F09]|uniref:hypothetical protein n=1 Tax=Pontibacter sp. HSC-36F09 TaxID=2910966 RepID=UPI0020A079BF|nr:hypothetical protein [Pontibacter sp. HSC-36F09]MCP2045075.1 hypothetical protein [Pontibacter sp. HSC-36F09]